MARVTIVGATGSLGTHVVQQAVAAGHDVSVIVRSPSKLPDGIRTKVVVQQCDLRDVKSSDLAAMFRGQDAVINTAGQVTEGQTFVNLVDKVVTSLEALPGDDFPACWFLAGAGILDFDNAGRQGVDLPKVRSTYWPHRANFERISRSKLDWRILCPGPMVEQPPLGLAVMRTSLDRLPVRVPSFSQFLPGVLFLPVFGYLIPEMIVPYADAASLILGNLARKSTMSHHRIGIALPVGLRGQKDHWVARPKNAA